MNGISFINKEWIPPMNLWLILDVSRIGTFNELGDIYNIIKRIPNNGKEVKILKHQYMLIMSRSQVSVQTPKIFKNENKEIPFMKKAPRIDK